MTAPDDLARTLADWLRDMAPIRGVDADDIAAGLLADDGPLASLQAKAWDEGSNAGWHDRTEDFVSEAVGKPYPGDTLNPYRSRPPADTDTRSGP